MYNAYPAGYAPYTNRYQQVKQIFNDQNRNRKMIIKRKMLFILIGNDSTGKTTLQKMLIEKLCGIKYETLKTNLAFDIKHPEIKRKYNKISFGNRSFQEKKTTYQTVDEYFEHHFNEQKIAIISSHLNKSDLSEMLKNGKRMYYNVTGVFFTNSIEQDPPTNRKISELNWDERLVIENPTSENKEVILKQLDKIADNIVIQLVNKTNAS